LLGRVLDWDLLQFSIGAVIAPVLLPGFFFAFEAYYGRLDPFVLPQGCLTRLERLLQRGDVLVRAAGLPMRRYGRQRETQNH
jgi:uncharacterized protein (DUF2384 family)